MWTRCHVKKCSCNSTLNAMLQFGFVPCNYFNLGFSKSVCMLGNCRSFSTLSTSITWSPSKCWSLDGDVKFGIDVNPLSCSFLLWNLSTAHLATFLNLFRTCILQGFWVSIPICCLIICWLLALPPSLTTISIISFLFYGFDCFLCYPSTANSSFDTSSTVAMEAELWCFASYLIGGSNPWNVLNEQTYLMIISTTNFWSCSLSIFV